MTTLAATTPAGACDCHIHLYEHGHALAAGATFQPPHAPLAAYRQMQQRLGLERVVLVQPTGYGFDNRLMLDAMAALGGAARGVVVVPADTSDAFRYAGFAATSTIFRSSGRSV